jgi:hypothetical protein
MARNTWSGAINSDGVIDAVHYAEQPLDIIYRYRHGSGPPECAPSGRKMNQNSQWLKLIRFHKINLLANFNRKHL